MKKIARNVFLFGAILGLTQMRSEVRANPPRECSVTTQVSEIEIYGSTFGLFEEPDDDEPGIVYDLFGNVYHDLELQAPIASYTYARSRQNAVQLVASSLTSKNMPYLFHQDPRNQLPPFPPFVYAALRSHLPSVSDADFAAYTHPYLNAVGHFEEPNPADVSGRLHGIHFEVTRDISFTVQVQFLLAYEPPGGPSTAVVLPFLTNGQVAAINGLPPAPGIENLPAQYTWHTSMTLSTDNAFVRLVADEPPPLGEVFPPGMTVLDLSGSRLDHAGNYAIVGYNQATFSSTQPGILTLIFGSEVPNVTMAVRQVGVLSQSCD